MDPDFRDINIFKNMHIKINKIQQILEILYYIKEGF